MKLLNYFKDMFGTGSSLAHVVNLAQPPRLPFDDAEVVKHEGEIKGKRVVKIELRSDDNLYIDGCKVVVKIHEGRNTAFLELEDGTQMFLNGNVLDHLYDNPELFPQSWKKAEKDGTRRFISFPGSTFTRPSDGTEHVPSIAWDFLYGGLDRVW